MISDSRTRRATDFQPLMSILDQEITRVFDDKSIDDKFFPECMCLQSRFSRVTDSSWQTSQFVRCIT